MRIRGSAYLFIATLLAMLFAILWAVLTMPDLESQLMPILFGSIVFFLAAIGLWQELRKEGKAEGEAKSKGKSREPWGRSLVNFGWVIGFLLVIYLLGHVIAIGVFVLSYMKWLGTRWGTAVLWAVVAAFGIYFAFEIGLQLPLYRGLIPAWLLSGWTEGV
ncbi:MAG: tripartite tricarboxylate transporter TctB family protein [Chloroflexota bacterium]